MTSLVHTVGHKMATLTIVIWRYFKRRILTIRARNRMKNLFTDSIAIDGAHDVPLVRFHSNSLWTIVLIEREARQIDGHTHKIYAQTQTAGEGEERKGEGGEEKDSERVREERDR